MFLKKWKQNRKHDTETLPNGLLISHSTLFRFVQPFLDLYDGIHKYKFILKQKLILIRWEVVRYSCSIKNEDDLNHWFKKFKEVNKDKLNYILSKNSNSNNTSEGVNSPQAWSVVSNKDASYIWFKHKRGCLRIINVRRSRKHMNEKSPAYKETTKLKCVLG